MIPSVQGHFIPSHLLESFTETSRHCCSFTSFSALRSLSASYRQSEPHHQQHPLMLSIKRLQSSKATQQLPLSIASILQRPLTWSWRRGTSQGSDEIQEGHGPSDSHKKEMKEEEWLMRSDEESFCLHGSTHLLRRLSAQMIPKLIFCMEQVFSILWIKIRVEAHLLLCL